MLLSKILRAADHPYLMGKGGRMVRKPQRRMRIILSDVFYFFKPENLENPKVLSPQPNNDLKLMQGLSMASLKHHVALQVSNRGCGEKKTEMATRILAI